MADEAATTIVLKMRDEASDKMKNFGTTTQQTTAASLDFRMALTASGSALTAIGSLVNQMDSRAAKLAGTFITTAGAILTTTSAIMTMLPYLRQLVNWLRSVAAAQALVRALSGPLGWVGLGAAAGVGVATAVAITAGRGGTTTRQTTVVNNIQGSVITERELGELTRQEIVKAQDRNASSGIQ